MNDIFFESMSNLKRIFNGINCSADNLPMIKGCKVTTTGSVQIRLTTKTEENGYWMPMELIKVHLENCCNQSQDSNFVEDESFNGSDAQGNRFEVCFLFIFSE